MYSSAKKPSVVSHCLTNESQSLGMAFRAPHIFPARSSTTAVQQTKLDSESQQKYPASIFCLKRLQLKLSNQSFPVKPLQSFEDQLKNHHSGSPLPRSCPPGKRKTRIKQTTKGFQMMVSVIKTMKMLRLGNYLKK